MTRLHLVRELDQIARHEGYKPKSSVKQTLGMLACICAFLGVLGLVMMGMSQVLPEKPDARVSGR